MGASLELLDWIGETTLVRRLGNNVALQRKKLMMAN